MRMRNRVSAPSQARALYPVGLRQVGGRHISGLAVVVPQSPDSLFILYFERDFENAEY